MKTRLPSTKKRYSIHGSRQREGAGNGKKLGAESKRALAGGQTDAPVFNRSDKKRCLNITDSCSVAWHRLGLETSSVVQQLWGLKN